MCRKTSFVATCPVKYFTGQVAIISSGNTCQQKIFENIISEQKIYQSILFSSYLVLISKIQIFPMGLDFMWMHIGLKFCHFLLVVLSITEARKTNIWTKKMCIVHPHVGPVRRLMFVLQGVQKMCTFFEPLIVKLSLFMAYFWHNFVYEKYFFL